MPPQEKLPIFQLVVVKSTDEAVRRDLDARLKALEAAVERSQEMLEEW